MLQKGEYCIFLWFLQYLEMHRYCITIIRTSYILLFICKNALMFTQSNTNSCTNTYLLPNLRRKFPKMLFVFFILNLYFWSKGCYCKNRARLIHYKIIDVIFLLYLIWIFQIAKSYQIYFFRHTKELHIIKWLLFLTITCTL